MWRIAHASNHMGHELKTCMHIHVCIHMRTHAHTHAHICTHTHVLDAARFVNHGSLGTEWVFGGWTESVCAMSIQWWTESVWDCV